MRRVANERLEDDRRDVVFLLDVREVAREVTRDVVVDGLRCPVANEAREHVRIVEHDGRRQHVGGRGFGARLDAERNAVRTRQADRRVGRTDAREDPMSASRETQARRELAPDAPHAGVAIENDGVVDAHAIRALHGEQDVAVRG